MFRTTYNGEPTECVLDDDEKKWTLVYGSHDVLETLELEIVRASDDLLPGGYGPVDTMLCRHRQDGLLIEGELIDLRPASPVLGEADGVIY